MKKPKETVELLKSWVSGDGLYPRSYVYTGEVARLLKYTEYLETQLDRAETLIDTDCKLGQEFWTEVSYERNRDED